MLHGTDVSRYQGTIDWDAFAPNLQFVAIRATRGLSYVDPELARNRAEAAKRGIIRGYYHFAVPAEDAVAQAEHFCETVGSLAPGELDLILDLEWSQHHGKAGYAWTAADTAYLQDWTRTFIAAVERRYPERSVILYTGYYFWKEGLGGSADFIGSPLWIAWYTHGEDPVLARPPIDPTQWEAWAHEKPLPHWAPWPKWTFWQFTARAVVPGVTANVDANLFNGTMEELRALARLQKTERAPARVEGRVLFQHGLPASRIALRLYHRGFGCSETLLGEAITDADGGYVLRYDAVARAMNLEARAVDPQGREVLLSRIRFNAQAEEVLNLVAPAAVCPLAPEFVRLMRDVSAHVGTLADLARAREDGECRDLTMLRRATAWDARHLAMAVIAVRLSAETGIATEALYALFRSGLPTSGQRLSAVSSERVAQALRKANDAGIVALTREQIAHARTAFDGFARKTRLDARAPGALSSASELLARSGLTPADRQKFEEVYVSHRGDAAELWKRAAESGIPAAQIAALKLQGKLAHLTSNNAALTQSLALEIGSLEQLADLANKDLHRSEEWKSRILALSGKDPEKLQALVPPAYVGTTPADRLDAYADDLARKVRLSFPTQVVSRMIEKEEISLGDQHSALQGPVRAFLQTATSLGFELGQPLETFVRAHQDTLFPPGPAREGSSPTMQAVKKLQRLYQITPTNEALTVLAKLGFGSAQEIASLSRGTFLDRFGKLFGSKDEADLVYRKAQQVSTVSYNFFTGVKLLDSAPPAFAVSPSSPTVKEDAKANLLKHVPTLESLFGSLDFCECEHCRSVLSPAAYLVDLLKFLDPGQTDWTRFGTEWQGAHAGKAYMQDWKQKNGLPRPHATKTPYSALAERRPDLPYLPLTCENTNTVLPYIDVVNEILEYQIAHGGLDAGAVHDTAVATTAELLAEPQNILREVYDEGGPLRSARYPLSLPFDLWLETVRLFLSHFESPLWQVLEAFRKSDDLFAPAQGAHPYYRADVFAEQLGMSPGEQALFTDASPLAHWFGLYGYETAAAALGALKSAKTLSRKLGVSYQELVDLVLTEFVNPGLSTLVLVDPDTGCNFDATTLQNADGTPADAMVFLKLNLFVRLWRKLGWTVDETDRALSVFLPAASLPLTAGNIGPAFQTALIYLSHLATLDGRVSAGKGSRRKLLVVWSNLPTTGKSPLYAELFLTPSVSKIDPVFGATDPAGHVLATPGVLVKDHVLALQAALGVTAGDIGDILRDAGMTLDVDPEGVLAQAELSLDTVSRLYRHCMLAKALALSIPDFIALKGLSGLDPFEPLEAAPLSTLASDHPFTRTLRFVEVAAAVAESGFSVEDLDYLLRHRFDPVGKYRERPEVILALVKVLAAEISRIEAEHTLPEDPSALTDEWLSQKLALVLPADVTATLLGMWTGVVEYEAPFADAPLAAALVAAASALSPPSRIHHDAVRARISVQGVLSNASRAALEAAVPSPLIAAALATVQDQATRFFEGNLAQPVGFLGAADFQTYFASPPTAELRASLAAALLPFLRRRLVDLRIVQALAAGLEATPAVTEILLRRSGGFVSDPSAPGKPLLEAFAAAAGPGVSATFFASQGAEGPPLGTAPVDSADTAASIAGGTVVARPAGTNSARFEGYLEVPTAGPYRFFAALGKLGTGAELSFTHLPDPLFRGTAAADDAEVSEFLDLKPGVLYRFTFEAKNLGSGDATLLVQGENLPKGSLNRLTLYPEETVERIQRARLLLEKTLHLAAGFAIGEREIAHFLTYESVPTVQLPTRAADDTAGSATTLFNLFLRLGAYAHLRRDASGDTEDLIDLFERAHSTHPATVDVAVARSTLFGEVCGRFAEITRRDGASVKAAAQHLGLLPSDSMQGAVLRVEVPGFTSERDLGRLWEVLSVVGKLGAPTGSVATWATPAPDFDTALDLKNALKARYDAAAWQRAAQPIFDKLRQRQRDALVAHVLHHHPEGFEDANQLFEYFLVDPGMEPVVQTSRLRLAISSVQTFIQRCFLNLEPHVHPSALRAEHWEWMKRYRVWEANRKIFLYPENWLEPELRDDKTHLFQALEGALLQGDVSNDLAEEAFFRYLTGLDTIARLEIVTMYLETNPLDSAASVLHVIGRTYGLPHKYFYRCYVHQAWTPWEPVDAEIEGDHVAIVVWRGRLHLFWVTFLEKAKQSTDETPKPVDINNLAIPGAPMRQVEVQLSFIEHFQGEWTARTSSGFGDPVVTDVPRDFNARQVLLHVTKEIEDGEEGAVTVHLNGPFPAAQIEDPQSRLPVIGWRTSFRLASRNDHPHVVPTVFRRSPPYPGSKIDAPAYAGNGALKVKFVQHIETKGSMAPVSTEVIKDVLRKGDGKHSLVFSNNPLEMLTQNTKVVEDIGPLIAPFFYQDRKHTFYVEPTLTETTTRRWEDWAIPVHSAPTEELQLPPLLKELVPIPKLFEPPEPIEKWAPDAVFEMDAAGDWATNPAARVALGETFVGEGGAISNLELAEGTLQHG